MDCREPLASSDTPQQLGYPRKLLEAEQALTAHPNPAVALMLSTTARMMLRQIASRSLS
jgi:hypothetical protein